MSPFTDRPDPGNPDTGEWIVDGGIVWYDAGFGASLEPWEALPGTAQGQAEQAHFDAAYDALVSLINDRAALAAERDALRAVARRLFEGWMPASDSGDESYGLWYLEPGIDDGPETDEWGNQPMAPSEQAAIRAALTAQETRDGDCVVCGRHVDPDTTPEGTP